MAANRGGRHSVFFFSVHAWCLCLFVIFASAASSQNRSCDPDDLRALRGFLSGLQESKIPGWSSSDCCSWRGVSCDSSPATRVISLDLSSMGLQGILSGSLSGLSRAKSLNLSSNSLSGEIPPAILQLPLLELLDLSSNRFSGPFPPSSNLPSIHVFNASSNLFNGSHPILGGSTNLTVFDISSNSFSGRIDPGLCDASSLIQVLRFSANFFAGEIPAGIGNCSFLDELYLDGNGLSGSLPLELFQLPYLRQLFLQGNALSGTLGPEFGNLSSIVAVDVSENSLSGAIPDVFSTLRKLESFSAVSNYFTGGLPATLSASASLSTLSVRNNSLGGEIVLDFRGMKKLRVLDLGSNSFTGAIPESLSHCTGLQTLNLAANDLAGPIPAGFENLTALSYLSLSKNKLVNLSSALKILGASPSLAVAVLTRNFQGETIPSDIQGFSGIKVFVMANSGLSGSVPRWLARCGELRILDLSWNRLEGTIPPWFGDLGSLFYLDLSNNSLSGEIPDGLTKLRFLMNSGNVSPEQGSSETEFPFFMKRNASARGLQYNQVSSFPPSLVLGHNLLVGTIPPGLGDLKNLIVLDLSWNSLTGPIPGELSAMTDMETLELSHNSLTGGIPQSLTNLSFLSSFDVAYNGLVGTIPVGGQFSTFPSASFDGNTGLCGFNFTKCIPQTTPEKTEHLKNKGVLLGLAFGIGIGTSVLLALLYAAVAKTSARLQDDSGGMKVADAGSGLLESAGSTLVLLFHQNKDNNNKELSIVDIMSSTDNFGESNIIGCGGFGLVYRATLPDGTKAAIKRLSGDFCQMEREFRAEVETLSTARHRNLVQLQGYCRVGSDRLLIYSYMENGSLDYWLHETGDGGGSGLDWRTRLRIARGAARGLEYLHQSCHPHILHRDIKSSNILLDEHFEACLADFGLARLVLPSDTHVTTDVVGTLGYIPPEYAQSSVATFKGDIYSFGIVLLELLTGRRPVDMCRPRACRDLISWIAEMRKEKREVQVFDPCVYDRAANETEMMQVLEIAWLCVNGSPKLRPPTHQLLTLLENVGLDSSGGGVDSK